MKNKHISILRFDFFLFLSLALILQVGNSNAQIGTPNNPSYGNVQTTATNDYYNSLIGLSGAELRTALQNIVVNSNTRGQTYGDAWLMLEEADENPDDDTQVWQVYIETGIAKTAHVSGSTGWNREHVFPQSRGGFSGGTSTSSDGKDVYFSTSASDIAHAHADAHQLRASDAGENANRGSLDFADVNGPRTKNSSFYEPPVSAKGDIARALFYMAIRYNDLSLADGDQDGQIIGDLASLIEWHGIDLPDDYEMRRNNVIYDWQNNRNPFTDMPALVDYLWGDLQGVAWPGNTTTGIRLSSVDAFPIVPYGSVSEIKTYEIEGTELGAKLNIDAPEHFEISLTNNTADFVKNIEIAITDNELEATTIYVRFVPERAVGAEISAYIIHYSGNKSTRLTVSGTEGNPLLTPDELYTQDFETDCAPDWLKYSVSSNKNWDCDTYGHNGGTAIAMNNYEADTDSEDWLVSPLFNTSGYSQAKLKYWMEWDYSGSVVELFFSTDYSGTGNPNDATWTKLKDVTSEDNWTEYVSDLHTISSASFYLAFKHVSTPTSSSRINLDDISLIAIELAPIISSSKASIDFTYTAPNTTSASISYTINAENLESDIELVTEAPFELSADETTWANTLTVAQAEADGKLLYVRCKPTTDYLGGLKGRITHSGTNATDLIVDILVAANTDIPANASSLTNDKTLDLVSWNLEWFGTPSKSGHASTWDEQLTSVSTKIIDLDADIYALQEVVADALNGNYLDSLIVELNNQAGADTYTGLLGPRYSLDDREPTTDYPAQRVCYIYKTANFANVESESMFSDIYPDTDVTSIEGYTGTASLFWASGRLPFLLKADVTVDGITAPINFINIHGKCCSDSKSRKTADALFLKDELDENYDTKNVIILGDYNDYHEGSMSGGESPYASWFADCNSDYLRAAGASIDHISVSNELYYEYQSLTNNSSVETTDVSDHDPILLRVKLDETNFNGQVVCLDEIEDTEFSTEAFTVNGQSSNNLPVSYEILSGPATILGNVLTVTDIGEITVKVLNSGNSNTLAASDEKQFEVTKATQTISFELADEINLSEGSLTLSASSSSGLPVSFELTSGAGTIAGNELSFTEAGNISVKAYHDGNDKYKAASKTETITVIDNLSSIADLSKLSFSIYPNPSNGIININNNSDYEEAIIKIYTSTGIFVESYSFNKSSKLDLSHLNSGFYIITIKSGKYLFSKKIILE